VRFNHVTLIVAAFERSVAFYRSLDLVPIVHLWRGARVRDPDGHDIRLYFAEDNRLNPPWKVR